MKLKKLIFPFLLILFIFQFFKLPFSAYNVLKWDYENRMVQAYGYCEKESWGFYNYVIKKFELKQKPIKIINHQGKITLEYFFNLNKSNKINSDYYLILNYQSKDDETIFENYKNLKNYKILHRDNNCYLLSNV